MSRFIKKFYTPTCLQQVANHSIYVWGGAGAGVPGHFTRQWIQAEMETSFANAKRAIANTGKNKLRRGILWQSP